MEENKEVHATEDGPLIFDSQSLQNEKLFGDGQDLNYTDTIGDFTELSNAQQQPQVSFFSTVMNLLNSLVGSEILSISSTMNYCGLVTSVALMTLAAFLSYMATIMIVRLQFRTHSESMNDMARKLLGKWGSLGLTILTLLFTYSCCVAYLIIGGDNIKSWLSLLHHEEWMMGSKRYLTMFIYSLVLPVALTIPRKLGFLSIFSTFSIFCLFVYAIVMIWKCSASLASNGINVTTKTATINLSFFNALAIYALMFALPAIVLPIIKNADPRIRSRYRIIGTAFMSCYLFVLIPGVLGYLNFGSSVNEIILNNFSNRDVIIQVIRVAFFVVVTASFPVIALTISADLSALIFNVFNPAELPWKKRAIVLLVTNIPPVVIAMACPSIAPVLSIGGALGGCMTSFFFPPLLWIKNSSHGFKYYKNILCLCLSVFGVVSAAIATYQAVVDVVK
ncbi:Transmembrane amino acid transporter protein [Histomonas meleagridis]|uniref:Transmembrane amino acid transporter protein n=1 Tax=Histomonas meleagridis TaxID=135588 RepID=UPI00355A0559|nr:Transmembrane amino acid transporter protein [Histomonas meleagridis]KAH0804761.1 Transmembrane amino acid transporter protein [Histomonas meleagridis]